MKDNNTKNTFMLIVVRVMAILIGLIGTRLLSSSFSYLEYGTYSQLNLIVEVMTSLSILGMADGVNFYFSKARDSKDYSFVNATFGLQLLIGIFDALFLILLSEKCSYMLNNPHLKQYIIWIAFRPLLLNYISMLTVINVAVGNSSIIAIRNGLFSLFKFVGILIAIYYDNDILAILIVFLGFDFISVLIYMYMYQTRGPGLKIIFIPKYWREIISFCFPIGAYVLVNGLFRSADKIVVSLLGNVADFSIYTNGAAQLPFDIVWTSVQMISLPIITYNITSNDKYSAFKNFCCCMRINLVFTIPLVIVSIITAPELIYLLYGDKYYDSIPIFRIYVLTEMIKFLGTSLILTTCGKGKYLLKVSLLMLGSNCVLDVILFKCFGLVGPAIATVAVTMIMVFLLLRKSLYFLEKGVSDFIKFINLAKYGRSILLIMLIVLGVKKMFAVNDMFTFFSAVLTFVLFMTLVVIFNKTTIVEIFNDFNRMK